MSLKDIPLYDWIGFGNRKLSKQVAIFNVDSAHNCPNRGTDRCQVEASKCYALQSEKCFPGVKHYRDQQGIYFSGESAESFANDFNRIVSAKRNQVKALRFNVASDIKSQSQLEKLEAIASKLNISVYTYSASSFLDFSITSALQVMASNDKIYNNYGKQSNIGKFEVVESKQARKQALKERQGKWYKCNNNNCGESCKHCLKARKVLQVLH